MINRIVSILADAPPVAGYCAPYNGNVCRNYINGRGQVWFNISQDNAGGWRNEEITMGIKEELINTLEQPCRSAAEVNTYFMTWIAELIKM